MATLQVRYLSTWKNLNKFVVGDVQNPLVMGRAELGGERMGVNISAHSFSKNMTKEVRDTVLHETGHVADDDSRLTKFAQTLKPEERFQLLEVVREVTGQEFGKNFDNAVNDPVEFMAEFSTKMVAGLTDSANPSQVVKEYMTYFGDPVTFWLSDQVKLNHTTIQEFMD